MAELFGTDEKDLRNRTASLLDDLAGQVKKPRRGVKRETAAERQRKAMAVKRQMATKSARRAPKPVKPKKISGVAAGKGFPLHERLLARTEPDGWYTHRQLLLLLPETNKNGLHGVIYAKLPQLGWIERRALVEFPSNRWLNKGMRADVAATQPGYVYRIGANLATERARAREKDAVLRSIHRE